MRRLSVILVLIGGFLITAELFAQIRQRDYLRNVPRRFDRGSEMRRPPQRMRRPALDVNSLLPRPQFLADSNAVQSRLKEFKEVRKSVAQLENSGEKVNRYWMHKTLEDRIDLAQNVEKQAVAELSLLRKLAEEEGAEQTVAAIDAIILSRQQRYKNVLTKIHRKNLRYGARDTRNGIRDRRDMRDRSRYGNRYNSRYGRERYNRYDERRDRYDRRRDRYRRPEDRGYIRERDRSYGSGLSEEPNSR